MRWPPLSMCDFRFVLFPHFLRRVAQRELFSLLAWTLVTKAMPLYRLWTGIEASFTSGDGYLDELCMEFVGLDSSRSRPLTRDISDAYSERCRAMLKMCR